MTIGEIEMLPVISLTSYTHNARTHSDWQVEQIVDSIKQFGFTNPIIIDEDNTIIAGHGRVMAALQMGMQTVPCLVVRGWSDAQKKAYVIADNKLALNAGWDNELLKLEFSSLMEMGFNLDLTGFSSDAIADILDKKDGLSEQLDGEDKGSNYIAIGKKKITVTDDELKSLRKCYDRYLKENGMEFGFGHWLADGRKEEK